MNKSKVVCVFAFTALQICVALPPSWGQEGHPPGMMVETPSGKMPYDKKKSILEQFQERVRQRMEGNTSNPVRGAIEAGVVGMDAHAVQQSVSYALQAMPESHSSSQDH